MQAQRTYLTVPEWFQGSPFHVQYTSENAGWEAATMRMASLTPYMEDLYSGPQPYDESISMILQGTTRFDAVVDGRSLQIMGEPGFANLFPANYPFSSRWDASTSVAFLMFNRTRMVELCLGITRGDPAQVQLHPTFGVVDPFLVQLVTTLADALRNGKCEPLYADTIAHCMILHLLKHYSNAYVLPVRTLGTLATDQRRLLDDYIDTYLHKKLSVTSLARMLHMSLAHFERLFLNTYHMPPYRYILDQRIARAKLLLGDPRRTLIEIATKCGFTSQSHFNRIFKQATGITPGQYSRHAR